MCAENKMKFSSLMLLLLVTTVHAGVFETEDLDNGYLYLNQLRINAGMTTLDRNAQLETSALNHANYLTDNFLTGHYESQGTSGFTGVRVPDRVAFSGYSSVSVSENVSAGDPNSYESIDGLMGAIYHRLGFLDFTKTEVGIGIAKSTLEANARTNYVYNMGNADLNELCQGDSFSGIGRYYFSVCQPDINIDGKAFEAAQTNAQENNPSIVLWPANGDETIPPAFFEESPDPLPGYSVSGYPTSIQFNPLAFSDENPKVTSFKLYHATDNTEVYPTRLLDKNSDPNGKLTSLEFVLFPLNRLAWNTSYRVEAKYSTTSDATERTLTWQFKTKDLGVPTFTSQGEGEVLSIPLSNSRFAVYIPPTSSQPNIGRISYRYQSGMSVNTDFEDGNTLLIDLTGRIGQQATFTLSDSRSFVAKIVEQPAEIVVAKTCDPAILSADLILDIPEVAYTNSSNETTVLWMHFTYDNNLRFYLSDYGTVDNPNCESLTTLSPDLNLHIPILHYMPSANETLDLWADLTYFKDMKFETKDYGFNAK